MGKVTTLGIAWQRARFRCTAWALSARLCLGRTVRRHRLAETVAALARCLIAMDDCSGGARVGPCH